MVNKYLKCQRILKDLETKEIAELMGISEQCYLNRENGRSKFSGEQYVYLANVLKVEVKDLIMGGM